MRSGIGLGIHRDEEHLYATGPLAQFANERFQVGERGGADVLAARVAEDHTNAHRLAEGISRIEGLSIDLPKIQTNIIFFNIVSNRLTADELLTKLGESGIKSNVASRYL